MRVKEEPGGHPVMDVTEALVAQTTAPGVEFERTLAVVTARDFQWFFAPWADFRVLEPHLAALFLFLVHPIVVRKYMDEITVRFS
jgi:hypothetical protein